MSEVNIIDIKESIFEDNNKEADKLRQELKDKKTFVLNIMSSPGSGKTTLLLRTLAEISNKYKISVMEADIDSAVDAEKIINAGGNAIQLHTGGMCHMDAGMTRSGLENVDVDNMDIVFLENVGNLVCPAEFDTGASKSIEILSVPEGDDKPLKYPLMFTICDAIIVNKSDCMPYFDFNFDQFCKNVRRVNPNAEIICLSAKTGEGFDKWINWLCKEVDEWNS